MMGIFRRALRFLIPGNKHPHFVLRSRIEEECKGKVLQGPFTGLRYGQESCGSVYYPKLLGTYERELYWVVEEIVLMRPALVVNIGAGEGYYACGFGCRLPDVPVIAFEAELKGRFALRQTIELNGLAQQVTVRGVCDAEALNQELTGKTGRVAIICDAEGFEYELLCPKRVPALRRASLLVETHDFILPNVSAIVAERFTATHEVKRITTVERTRSDFPLLKQTLYDRLMPLQCITFFLNERRPCPMTWLWMVPRG